MDDDDLRRTDDDARIRELIGERVRAVHAKDLDAVVSPHAADVLSFDVLGPLRYRGSAAIRERAAEWFSAYDGPIGYEVRDLAVTAGADVAFCHYLYRVSGTTTEGTAVEMWVRATVCLRKTDGAWTIAHEHQSVPFDPESGRALLDLEP
ncbi:MAG TPA: SgcJ/EcaC family oxidoreductase [Longimicrobium sp.]|jgi:uncharacterized protein (TIGR02246 family)